eukprot:360848-Chlamydomonas_euryale.AAC.2
MADLASVKEKCDVPPGVRSSLYACMHVHPHKTSEAPARRDPAGCGCVVPQRPLAGGAAAAAAGVGHAVFIHACRKR